MERKDTRSSFVRRASRGVKAIGATSFLVKQKGLRRLAKPTKKPEIEWKRMVETSEARARLKKPSYQDLTQLDDKRRKLLMLARETSPIDSLGRVWLIGHTVIPRLLKHGLTWLVVCVFGITATITRMGVDVGDLSDVSRILDGVSTMVTFMIIFYVSYCYNRYTEQYADVQSVMHAITNACVSARVAFTDKEEVHRLWRYLNMLHASAYCGLTEELTEENFLLPFAERNLLFGDGEMVMAQGDAAEFAVVVLSGFGSASIPRIRPVRGAVAPCSSRRCSSSCNRAASDYERSIGWHWR